MKIQIFYAAGFDVIIDFVQSIRLVHATSLNLNWRAVVRRADEQRFTKEFTGTVTLETNTFGNGPVLHRDVVDFKVLEVVS